MLRFYMIWRIIWGMGLNMKDIFFFRSGSSSIHELQLGWTLIRFIEFDLKYFGDQCAQIYRRQLREGKTLFEGACVK